MNKVFFDKHSQAYAELLAELESNDKSKLGVIYIEDISDKPFWQKIATQHEIKLYSENGKTITGKSKLLEICSPNQLIAIDSDFDNLCPNHRSESILFSEKKQYILQTYAHGRENLIFSPKYLYEVLEHKFKLYIDTHPNPILTIFKTLSEIWFEPYQKFLYLYDKKCQSHNDWIKEISFQNTELQEIALENNFDNYKQRIVQLDLTLINQINNQTEFENFCQSLTRQQFVKENTHLFIRCHDFEERFVMPIMDKICGHRIKTEMALIQNSYYGDEAKNRKEQCKNYFQKTNGIPTILHHYFYDVYFQTTKNSQLFLNKIIQDYNKIINA